MTISGNLTLIRKISRTNIEVLPKSMYRTCCILFYKRLYSKPSKLINRSECRNDE